MMGKNLLLAVALALAVILPLALQSLVSPKYGAEFEDAQGSVHTIPFEQSILAYGDYYEQFVKTDLSTCFSLPAEEKHRFVEDFIANLKDLIEAQKRHFEAGSALSIKRYLRLVPTPEGIRKLWDSYIPAQRAASRILKALETFVRQNLNEFEKMHQLLLLRLCDEGRILDMWEDKMQMKTFADSFPRAFKPHFGIVEPLLSECASRIMKAYFCLAQLDTLAGEVRPEEEAEKLVPKVLRELLDTARDLLASAVNEYAAYQENLKELGNAIALPEDFDEEDLRILSGAMLFDLGDKFYKDMQVTPRVAFQKFQDLATLYVNQDTVRAQEEEALLERVASIDRDDHNVAAVVWAECLKRFQDRSLYQELAEAVEKAKSGMAPEPATVGEVLADAKYWFNEYKSSYLDELDPGILWPEEDQLHSWTPSKEVIIELVLHKGMWEDCNVVLDWEKSVELGEFLLAGVDLGLGLKMDPKSLPNREKVIKTLNVLIVRVRWARWSVEKIKNMIFGDQSAGESSDLHEAFRETLERMDDLYDELYKLLAERCPEFYAGYEGPFNQCGVKRASCPSPTGEEDRSASQEEGKPACPLAKRPRLD